MTMVVKQEVDAAGDSPYMGFLLLWNQLIIIRRRKAEVTATPHPDMKTSTVCLLLGVSVLLLSGPTDSAVSLRVSPDLQQFFIREGPLTLSCDEDGQTADGWTVKRRAGEGTKEETKQCGGDQQDFGRIEGSNCIISNPSPNSDCGVYWCERSGDKSEEINITVTDLNFKVEIPALPVPTGSDVTLRCRTRDGSTPAFNVLKDGKAVTGSSKGELIISNVQQSDEGFYSCSDGLIESTRSRLRVKGNRPAVSMETSQHDGGDQGLDGEYDDVTTEHDF
ncbi:low affinity immunoglobulin gamma Fc region receptor II-like isoform X2 [Scomber scombrus]